MSERRWTLSVLPETLAIARLEPHAAIPEWLSSTDRPSRLLSITRTSTELSIVCLADRVPEQVVVERDWRALEVAGPLDFSEVGVLASLTALLAGAGVSLFALSTFDTDYLLVRQSSLDRALEALREGGHTIVA